ncbi:MAG: hypothetical protein HQ567_22195 [Candidatus Nealsonbacteria bacterium]|nr:hypothetical protein [Candidatus Nealsonbacteria bacterium]
MITEAAKAFFQALAGFIVLAAGLVYWQWDWIVAWDIKSDLDRYASEVRQSECTLEQKEELLDEIDSLRDRLRDGETTTKSRWSECDDAVRDMCKHGITADEAVLIVRELRRVKKDVN